MKMKCYLQLLTISVVFSFCSERVTKTVGGQVTETERIRLGCTKPSKRYAKNIESSVKTKLNALGAIPPTELEARLKTTVVQLADYSSAGLDKDLVLFRVCEMSNNLKLNGQQAESLIKVASGTWDQELEKKKSSQP